MNDAADLPTIAQARLLLAKGQTLVAEVEALRQHVRARDGAEQGIGLFIKGVQTEVDELQVWLHKASVLQAQIGRDGQGEDEDASGSGLGDVEDKLRAQVAFTNVHGLEGKWSVVKRCKGLLSLSSVYQHGTADGAARGMKNARRAGTNVVVVDAVVDSGRRWLRICGDKEKRLLMQMAESGWGVEDEDGFQDDEAYKVDDDEPIVILRIASQMVKAARKHRFRYQSPTVHIFMTRVSSGHDRGIDDLIRVMRRLGGADVQVVVDCANSALFNDHQYTESFDVVLEALLRIDSLGELTDPLNLDCSVLVALASDITYQRVEVESWQHRQLLGQIEKENEDPGAVLRMLYSTLGARQLVCTYDTAWHFLVLVYQLGRSTEIERAHLLVPDGFAHEWTAANPGLAQRRKDPVTPRSRTERIRALQSASVHPVPADVQLPLQVVGARHDWTPQAVRAAVAQGRLPPVAAVFVGELKPPNLSTFMHGWAAGLTTYSANADMEKKFVRLVEENRDGADDAGPGIALCRVNRPLAATPRFAGFAMADCVEMA
ncbi:hypothetical protein P8C59_009054 [Phyllachora maydis]|uniref:DUF1308 domain-containing protein n=1 Tax=Phyllachora maydis TaxID=1825666 RepID=A0AAD9IBV7_9PEZI|nr:hypothetical protein P8C59_009054 [Phyllachora maydis]